MAATKQQEAMGCLGCEASVLEGPRDVMGKYSLGVRYIAEGSSVENLTTTQTSLLLYLLHLRAPLNILIANIGIR